MILTFVDDIDSIGKNTINVKESFLRIVLESQKVGLKIDTGKTKYMHVIRNPLRDGINQNITTDNNSNF